jgi:hypothetical protein
MKLTFIDIFYKTIEVFKNEYKSLLGYIVAAAFINALVLMAAGATDTPTIITIALIEVIVGSLINVIFYNHFLAKLRNNEFSLRKALWDYPTFIFYSLGFGFLTLIGIIALVIPGLLVIYFYSLSPIVAILFDEDDRGILSKTKEMISSNYSTYTLLFFIMMIWNGVNISGSQVVAVVGKNPLIITFISVTFAMVTYSIAGICLTFLEDRAKNLQNDHE